ncbi:hypothetical protein MFLAVUS_002749 [Mucor flavus]|uniref:Uncharacterized protein n=1 Tax=Mucor flavus TaxID=439312 RepID=A0ABP9YR65_9FUNG
MNVSSFERLINDLSQHPAFDLRAHNSAPVYIQVFCAEVINNAEGPDNAEAPDNVEVTDHTESTDNSEVADYAEETYNAEETGDGETDKKTQEAKLMLAKLGLWTSVVFEHDNTPFIFLTSPDLASVSSYREQTTGVWYNGSRDYVHSCSETVQVDCDHLIRQLKLTCHASKQLANTQHTEITDEITDWLEFPQQRYCNSQLLAGGILVEGSKAMLIDIIESYLRDSLLDAHHEKRDFGSATSFPSKSSRYGFFSICQLSSSDGIKLSIGSRTCN